MPTYDYICSFCGYKFELFQMMSDGLKKKCPKCKKFKLRRLIGSGSGIIFKGSGFFATDYRKKEKNDFIDKKDTKKIKKGPAKVNNKNSDKNIEK